MATNETPLEILPADVRATTATGLPVDISYYTGNGLVVLSHEASSNASYTNTIKLQESNLAAGASYLLAGDTDLDLNTTAGGLTKLGAKFTQSGVRQIKYIDLWLKKTGTIASDKVLTVYLEANNSTVPSDTPLATSATILANSLATTYTRVRFTLATPYELADSTVYWVCITSNYSASDSNFVSWHVDTLESAGNAATYTPSTWSAVTTQSALFELQQFAFADISGAAFAAVANTATCLSLNLPLDSTKSYIRAIDTIAGGSNAGASCVVLVATTPHK